MNHFKHVFVQLGLCLTFHLQGVTLKGQSAISAHQDLKIFFDSKQPDSIKQQAADNLLVYYVYHNADSLTVVSKALKGFLIKT